MARSKRTNRASNIAQYAQNDRILRPLSADQIPNLLFKHPPRAEDFCIRCECGVESPPPWSDKLSSELTHSESDDGNISVAGGVLTRCTSCGRQHELWFPEPDGNLGQLNLFGDEASQWYGRRYGFLYCYAFVGFDVGCSKFVKEQLYAVKKELRPDVDPAAWPLHVYDLRDPVWRQANKVSFDTAAVNSLLFRLALKIGELEGRMIYITVIPPIGIQNFTFEGSPEDFIRQMALTCALYGSTHHATKTGFHLTYTLEAQSDDHKRNGIDYFVEKIARGLRYDIGYHWSCHRKFVALPVTAGKGSHWELEIADLFAFMTRRYFYKRNIGHMPEIPLELLGPVTWGTIDNTQFRLKTSEGFPWDYFWPGLKKYRDFRWEMFQEI